MNDEGRSLWGKEQFQVWGGQFQPAHWLDFLNSWQWPDAGCWGIWEYVSSFEINSGALPPVERTGSLERVELFGENGHLCARRDNGCVFWHWVGQTDQPEPVGFKPQTYWKDHPQETFSRWGPKSALLWGEKKGEFWHDDRIGWAKLKYPRMNASRVRVRYWEFTRAGQVAFVWFTGLEEA